MIHRLLRCAGGCAAAIGFALMLASCGPAGRIDTDARDEFILVAGASGRAGHYVIQHLNEQGRNFRSLTRDADRAVEKWGEDFRDMSWFEGDVRDPARMNEVMQGVSRVICVIGANQISGPNSAEFVDYGGVRNLVDAAMKNEIEHFVLLTAIGVTDKNHPFNKATKGALEWRYKGEEYLRGSGLNYTIVRPGGLTNNPAGEQGVLIAQGDEWRKFLRSPLSRDDLALVLIAVLDEPGTRNATFEIVNDPSVEIGVWRSALAGLQADASTAQ